jgi:hypothetical protein
MPRPCSICTHPQRDAIDRALVAGESRRALAALYRVSPDAVERHSAAHLPATLRLARAAGESAHALDVMAELHRCFARMNMLFDACHDWLLDPDDPSRYTLAPRADEVMVLYLGTSVTGKPARKKAPLSRLLARLDDAGVVIDRGETRVADPRELAVKVAAQLKGQTELLAKLLGDLQQEGTITLTLSPEWHSLRAALLEALQPYPEARAAAAARLVTLEASAGAPMPQNGGVAGARPGR